MQVIRYSSIMEVEIINRYIDMYIIKMYVYNTGEALFNTYRV